MLAVEDGYSDSTESWAAVFRDLERRGLSEPRLVGGEGALGAWAAMRDVFPGAVGSAAGFHASGTVIDWLPKRLQPRARGLLGEIIEASARPEACRALEVFREEYGFKCPKALAKTRPRPEAADRRSATTPEEHWRHLRATNPSECSIATVRLRDPRDEGGRFREPRPWPTSCSRPRGNAGDGSSATSSSLTGSPA